MSEPQGFPAPGLLKTPHPIRLISSVARVNETTESTWLVRSYLWRPPKGHHWGYGTDPSDRHLQPTFFLFQRRSPTSHAAIGFPPRLAPRVHQRIAQNHAESTHFGQAFGSQVRPVCPYLGSWAEPSDTPSLPSTFMVPGGPFQSTSAKNAFISHLVTAGKCPHPRVPSPPGTFVKALPSTVFGQHSLKNDTVHLGPFSL